MHCMIGSSKMYCTLHYLDDPRTVWSDHSWLVLSFQCMFYLNQRNPDWNIFIQNEKTTTKYYIKLPWPCLAEVFLLLYRRWGRSQHRWLRGWQQLQKRVGHKPLWHQHQSLPLPEVGKRKQKMHIEPTISYATYSTSTTGAMYTSFVERTGGGGGGGCFYFWIFIKCRAWWKLWPTARGW